MINPSTDFEIEDVNYQTLEFQSKLASRLNIDYSVYDNNEIMISDKREKSLIKDKDI